MLVVKKYVMEIPLFKNLNSRFWESTKRNLKNQSKINASTDGLNIYFLMYEFRLSAPLPFDIFSASEKSKVICGKRKMANGESILALFWE